MSPVIIVGIIVAALLFVFVFIVGYVKAPPDKAYIISGLRRKPKILTGQAGFRIPFFQRKDELFLKQITIEVNTNGRVPTSDFINVSVSSVAKVRICPESDAIELAQRNFLNKLPRDIINDLQDSLVGNLREIIGTMSLKEISQDKETFSTQMKEKASTDMRALGIEIVTFNIQQLEDENGLIKDLGMDNTYSIQKDASISKAVAEQEVAVAQAHANKVANDARVAAQLEIEKKNNELAIRQAELKREADTKRAEAEAAFEIQNQQQRKTIEVESANADIARREREAELAMKEVEVTEKRLEAEIKKKAEAERFRKQQEADAELYERKQSAAAEKVQAEAARYAAEQVAEAVKVAGFADAEAIRAKGLAEAEAIREKAEAMKQYGHAAMTEMVIKALPEVARAVAEPISAIDSIKIFGSDSTGVSGLSGNVPTVMAQAMETVAAATGVDLASIMNAQSMEARITRNVNMTGLPQSEPSTVIMPTTTTVIEPPKDSVTVVEDILE